MTIVEGHCFSLNIHMAFDLSEIKMIPQQARKQLKAKLETEPVTALVVFANCIQLFWSVHSSPVHSPESRFYRDSCDINEGESSTPLTCSIGSWNRLGEGQTST